MRFHCTSFNACTWFKGHHVFYQKLQDTSCSFWHYQLCVICYRKLLTIHSPQDKPIQIQDNTTKDFYFDRLPRQWNYTFQLSIRNSIFPQLNTIIYETTLHPASILTISLFFLCLCFNCSKQPKNPNFETLELMWCRII